MSFQKWCMQVVIMSSRLYVGNAGTGALWMWDASKALVESSVLSGGESFAVVVDGTAKPLLKVRAPWLYAVGV